MLYTLNLYNTFLSIKPQQSWKKIKLLEMKKISMGITADLAMES